MAKAILPPWIKQFKGRLGGIVFRAFRSGETIVSRSPDMSAVAWSPAQQGHRRRFKGAIAYAKAAMAGTDGMRTSSRCPSGGTRASPGGPLSFGWLNAPSYTPDTNS